MRIVLNFSEQTNQQIVETPNPIYVRLADGVSNRQKEAVEGRVILDYDMNDELIGVEILG